MADRVEKLAEGVTLYLGVACRRISDALKQPDMFIEPPKPATQLTLEALNG